MSLYYFHVRDETDETLDPDGTELADLGAVEKAALAGARDLLAGDLKERGVMDLRYRIEAEDRSGRVVYSLQFKDAFRVLLAAA